MSTPVTHITFAEGTEIKPAFSRALSTGAIQRRDPDAQTSGYWLINASEERVRTIARESGQPFRLARADSFHPTR